MTRGVSTQAFERLTSPVTRPIKVVRWEHGGILETLSASGGVVFNGESYVTGDITSIVINGDKSATITLAASVERAEEVDGETWRGGKMCQIYSIAGDPVAEEDYSESQAYLEIDGVIDSSQLAGGRVTVKVVHKDLSGKFTPRHTFTLLTSTIPSPGTIITHEGDQYPLASKR
jgi:hypothetical protein